MSSAENVGNAGTAGNAHLTHVREDGSAHMVDVTAKNETSRTAVATGSSPVRTSST